MSNLPQNAGHAISESLKRFTRDRQGEVGYIDSYMIIYIRKRIL